MKFKIGELVSTNGGAYTFVVAKYTGKTQFYIDKHGTCMFHETELRKAKRGEIESPPSYRAFLFGPEKGKELK